MSKNKGKMNNHRSGRNQPKNTLGQELGLQGGFKLVRIFWNSTTKKYDRKEESWGNDVWEPYTDEGNVFSIRYIDGPKNGEVDW